MLFSIWALRGEESNLMYVYLTSAFSCLYITVKGWILAGGSSALVQVIRISGEANS